MNKRGWFVFLGAAVVVINALALFLLNNAKEAEKKLRVRNEIELSKKMVELSEQQGQISTLLKQKIDLEEQFNAKVAQLETALEDAEQRSNDLSASGKAAAEQLESLKREISQKDQKINELTRRLRTLEADKADLVASLEKLKSDASLRAEGSAGEAAAVEAGAPYDAPPAADSVKLGKIVVQKSSGRAARVEYVDRLYGFIVGNVGFRDGIKQKNVINVVRGNRLIGKAVVHQVRQDLAAATLLPDWSREEIRVGDHISRFN